MPNLFKANLMGHVGGPPETRYTAEGTLVATFSVAVNDRRKRGDDWEESTEWVRVTAFGYLAERALKQVDKGLPVYVEGRLRLERWTGRDGASRVTLVLTASELQVLVKTPTDGRAPVAPAGQAAAVDEDFDDDEMPF